MAYTFTYRFVDHDRITGEESPSYVLRVRDLPLEHKPREKLKAAGPSALSMAELVAIIWNVGNKNEDVIAMAQRVIREYGGQAMAHETNPQNLSELLAIPYTKACQLVACMELGRRQFATARGLPIYIRNAKNAYDHLSSIAQSPKEQLRGLYLNSRYEVIHQEIISIGSLTASIVHPREVFAPAIAYGAVGVIVAHNHPSGDATPTAEDIEITHQLRAAGTLLGIDLVDHLIITNTSHTSIVTQL
ncbi:DNA repair protein RadC [bacterium]|nr:MAG: DNA repair protein RadC [bacterium]